jgi:hypothetical protein
MISAKIKMRQPFQGLQRAAGAAAGSAAVPRRTSQPFVNGPLLRQAAEACSGALISILRGIEFYPWALNANADVNRHEGPAVAEILLSRQWVLHAGQGISHHRHGGGVLTQLAGNNFVERVRGAVMVIEVGAAVLQDAEGGHSSL